MRENVSRFMNLYDFFIISAYVFQPRATFYQNSLCFSYREPLSDAKNFKKLEAI